MNASLSSREAIDEVTQTSFWRMSPLEKGGVLAAFCIYLLFQVNASFHHGFWGQDFQLRREWIQSAVLSPRRFITVLEVHRTGPPLYELLCATIVKFTGGIHDFEVIALMNIALNTFGLVIFYLLTRLLLTNRLLRLACLTLILFLPFAMITEVVVASDALAMPIFFALVYLLYTLSPENSQGPFWLSIAGITILLMVGVATKLTFAVEIGASITAIWLYERTNVVSRVRAVKASIAILIIPGTLLLAGRVMVEGKYNLLLGTLPGSEMTLRDIVLFRSHDLHVLTAPSYDEKAPRPTAKIGVWPAHSYELLIKDKYSYPALLEVAIFTDIMNIYQYDPTDSYFGSRSHTNLRRMRLAAKTGLIFFFSVLIISPVVIIRSVWNSLIRRQRTEVGKSVIAICSLAWYVNIVLGLLVVPAYFGGYWLPRLVAPALLCFILLAFKGIDTFVRGRTENWAVGVLILVIFQSAVHLSFLWPWGLMNRY